MSEERFGKRYELAEGYPWAMGVGDHFEVAMREENIASRNVKLDWPEILWSPELPKYRLVLERVD